MVTVTPAATATITHVAQTTVDNAFTWTVGNSDYYTKGTDTVGKLTVKPAKLTVVTQGDEEEYDVAYAPARDLASLRVCDVLDAVDSYVEGSTESLCRTKDALTSERKIEEMKAAIAVGDANSLIIDLIDGK